MTNEIDNKVAEYLERAEKIMYPRWSSLLGETLTEIAKMIQLEEHRDAWAIDGLPVNTHQRS